MECGGQQCGCDAVQHVGVYSGKPGYAITFAASAAGSGKCCPPSVGPAKSGASQAWLENGKE